ncbi:DUF4148 domain-containing protein [Paraburkholderia tuberum]|uniref:DUF4148 domain-containing protein n=1 Tax=Paraburkholderia tuberum TaxID=157910 RepID=A0A1H1KL58_9BURK|nr:DUF4148 domain-containing protein [Paraburkholderia tuberum]SDR62976.1 protein of unknown function [Paraburkholderia tuberum]
MTKPLKASATLFMLALALALTVAGCGTGGMPEAGRHLSATECNDLTALRTNAVPTMREHQSELGALRKAGYNPSPWYDPYYPDDLQAAQRVVDHWYESECQQP